MVNTSLDKTYTAKEGGQLNYDPIPEGWYWLKVKEIEPWKPTTKTIQVIQKDENGNAIKGPDGKNLTETVSNCTFYNCNVKFEVVDGEYKGRIIFHNLTNHPNMDWAIPNFLYGLGLKDLAASQIQSVCVGKECKGNVYIDTYDRTVQNKETGIDEVQVREVNRIKSLKPLETPNNETNLDAANLGI